MVSREEEEEEEEEEAGGEMRRRRRPLASSSPTPKFNPRSSVGTLGPLRGLRGSYHSNQRVVATWSIVNTFQV